MISPFLRDKNSNSHVTLKHKMAFNTTVQEKPHLLQIGLHTENSPGFRSDSYFMSSPEPTIQNPKSKDTGKVPLQYADSLHTPRAHSAGPPTSTSQQWQPEPMRGEPSTSSRDEYLHVLWLVLLDVPISDVPKVIGKYEEIVGHGWIQAYIHIKLQHPTVHTQHRHSRDLRHQHPQDHVDLDPLCVRDGKTLGTSKKTILALSLLG